MPSYQDFMVLVDEVRPGLLRLPVVYMAPSERPLATNDEHPSTESSEMENPSEEPSIESFVPTTTAERSKARKKLYQRFREVFIVHVLTPSKSTGQDYDIFIYLKRHHGQPISIVKKAEFFFGPYWGDRIFEGQHEDDVIGVRVSAYGPFLCTCLVTFEDDEQVALYRYIDFEMGAVMAGLP